MNVTTETDDFPVLASLVISPNLQALLEFDDRLRASSESQKRPEVAPAGRVKHGRQPSWSEQEVPTVSLPPPRRRKKSGIPMSPKATSELESVAPSANILPGIEEPRESEEVVFMRPEDILEEVEAHDLMNPYLNSPPSPRRYFYPRPEDEDGINQPSGYYTLEKSRPMGRRKRQRSLSDQSWGGQSVSPRSAVGGSAGSRQKGGAATRPLLLHRHKASLSSAHSHQTGTSYEPSSSPEPRVSISSTIYSAPSFRSLSIPPFDSASPVQGSFIDLGSPPMSPSEESYESRPSKSFSCTNSPRSSAPHSRSGSPMPKPPIPTTPKPMFSRPHSLRRSSVDGKPTVVNPPTTTLSSAERAGLVKKTRKITQLFGQTPGPDLISLTPGASPLQRSLLSPDVRKGHRAIASISNPLHPSDRGVWPPPEETLYLNINGRRHSTPLSPTTTSSMWDLDNDSVPDLDQRSYFSIKPSRPRLPKSPAPSPVSFIDLSEDDSATETPKDITDYRRQAPFSRDPMIDDTASLLTVTSAQIHEDEQRRKREKLVKLHRFLGSRVPTDLILGLDTSQSPSLPPPASPDLGPEDTRKKFRMRRRRSSSYTGHTRPLTTQEDRMKSDLDMQEKALNVRRAAKMEKVFGVAPPQTLYHTRKSDSPTPQSPGSAPVLSVDIDTSPALVPLEPFSFFNVSGFGYKSKIFRRSATPDSSRSLISRAENNSSIEVYNSYHESLNSLIEIVDNDDKASLKAIHDILHAGDDNDDRIKRKVDDDDSDSSEPDVRSSTTIRNERRRSLPLCPSTSSMRSEYSITSPPPEISTFEQKRRRAAKLTNFFGVSHRDIMDGILESIESGVAEERGRGTLNQAQADDLLQRVWNLKTRT